MDMDMDMAGTRTRTRTGTRTAAVCEGDCGTAPPRVTPNDKQEEEGGAIQQQPTN